MPGEEAGFGARDTAIQWLTELCAEQGERNPP